MFAVEAEVCGLGKTFQPVDWVVGDSGRKSRLDVELVDVRVQLLSSRACGESTGVGFGFAGERSFLICLMGELGLESMDPKK